MQRDIMRRLLLRNVLLHMILLAVLVHLQSCLQFQCFNNNNDDYGINVFSFSSCIESIIFCKGWLFFLKEFS